MSGPQNCGRLSVIPSAAYRDKRLTPALIRALGALGCFGDKNGYCWPSQQTLGAMLGITQQGFSKSMRKLEELGYVEVIKRKASTGAHLSNAYRIRLDMTLAETHDRVREVVGGTTSEVVGGTTLEVVDPTTSEVVQNDKENDKKNDILRASARAVFAEWKRILGHPRAKWSSDKEAKIVGRLREGFTETQLIRVCLAAKASPHHMGQNETGTIYDSVDLLFRNASKVEWFLDLADRYNVDQHPTQYVIDDGRSDRIKRARVAYAEGRLEDARAIVHSDDEWIDVMAGNGD